MSKTSLTELILCFVSFFLITFGCASDRLSTLNRVVPNSSSEKGALNTFDLGIHYLYEVYFFLTKGEK